MPKELNHLYLPFSLRVYSKIDDLKEFQKSMAMPP